MAMIPQKIVEDVNDIPARDVVEAFTDTVLDYRGAGNSPFRPESDGKSFSTKGSMWCDWKLRGQGYIGGVTKFVQLYFGVSWPTAVLMIALKFGIINDSEASKYGFKEFETVGSTVTTSNKLSDKNEVEVDRAGSDVLDFVYRKMAEVCPLSEEDKEYLLNRGLSEEAIKERGFFSINSASIVRRLTKVIDSEMLVGVPGFYKKNGRIAAAISSSSFGIGIPVKNVNGQITGVQIRTKNKEKRYFWFSSSSRDGGVGPGSQIDYSYTESKDEMLVITEGIFKSMALNQYGYSAASVQGVGNWKGIVPSAKMNIIAFDSDLMENQQVISQVESLGRFLQKGTGKIYVWLWNPNLGKGIDDVIYNGNMDKVNQISFEEFLKRLDDFISGKTESILDDSMSYSL